MLRKYVLSWRYYSAPDRGAEYCDERVCLCVCVCLSVCSRSYLRNYTSDLHDFYACYYGRDSVLFWRCSDKLRRPTFGFMGDVIFAHKPRLLDVPAQLRRSSRAEA